MVADLGIVQQAGVHQGDPPPPPGKRGPTHTRYESPVSHAVAKCGPASCKLATSGSTQAWYATRRETFRGSNPRGPQLAATTQSLPASRGLHYRWSRGSCGRRSAYEAYSLGGTGSGDGGSHLAPCSWPTGTAPGRTVPPNLHDGLRRRLHGNRCGGVEGYIEWPRCGAPGGGAEASFGPAVRSFP